MQIDLQETDDEAADRGRLSEVVRLLGAAKGQDQTRLVLHTGPEEIVLQAPSVNLTESLEKRIKAVLGGCGNIRTTALPEMRERQAEAPAPELLEPPAAASVPELVEQAV